MRIGTRGSALALWQARWVGEMIARRHPDLTVEIIVIKTTGDVRQDVPLSEVAGKGVFVREIERTLQDAEIDIAVHSAKDLQSVDPPGLTIAAFCERGDPRDALVSPYKTLADLPQGARVATGAPRRVAQLAAMRPDLRFVAMRGNVDTRLAKLADGEADALVLAVAGLHRLGRDSVITEIIPPETCLPQVGQACVAVQCRANDAATHALVQAACDHPRTRLEVGCERTFLALLGGGCTAPVAAHAITTDDRQRMYLFALVATPDGSRILKTRALGSPMDGERIAQAAYEDLRANGAAELLANGAHMVFHGAGVVPHSVESF